MNCEHCQTTVEGVHTAHSLLIVLQKVDTSSYSYYQCGFSEDEHISKWQHWGCSHNHMLEMARQCVNEHHLEEKLERIPPRQVRLHLYVLQAGLKCKLCQGELTQVAYRFCTSRATPFSENFDNSLSDTGEWCCSLEHAQQSVLQTLNRYTNASFSAV
jgi:hypothetical protein